MNEVTALTVLAVFAMAFLAAVQPTLAQGRNPWAPAGQSYVPQDPQTTGNVFSGSGRPSGGYGYQAPPATSPAPAAPAAPAYAPPAGYGAWGYGAPYGYPMAPLGGYGGFGGFGGVLGGYGLGAPGYGLMGPGYGPYADPHMLATPGFAAPWVLGAW